MSESKITRTFPPGEPEELDPTLLRQLLERAYTSCLTYLQMWQLPMYERNIFVPHRGGCGSQTVEFPKYGHIWDNELICTVLTDGEIRRLLDYIWDCGQLRKTLTGADPQRRSWELRMLRDILDCPISHAVENAAIEEASDTGRVTMWRLPVEHRDLAIDATLAWTLYGQRTYIAKCPLAWTKGAEGRSWPAGENMTLRAPTAQERIRYLSKHHNIRILWTDTFSGLLQRDVALAEIICRVDMRQQQTRPLRTINTIVEEIIADNLDVLKWALMVCGKHKEPLIEAMITYEDTMGGPLMGPACFRRQHANQGTVYNLDEIDMSELADTVNLAIEKRQTSTDLKQAFWYWGRSSTAALKRDALLEAVIGLERLLVPYAGESRYRFGLHGASILAMSAQEAEEVAAELREIYKQRSSMAHGQKEAKGRESSKARQYLSKVILSVLELSRSGVLDPSRGVAEQIEQLVLLRCPIRATLADRVSR